MAPRQFKSVLIIIALVLGRLVLASAVAEAAPLTEEEREKLAMPERGFYTEFDFGSTILTNTLTDPGILVGVGVGADIGKYIQVGGHFWASTNNSSGVPVSSSSGDILPPDAHMLLLMGDLKLLYPASKRFNWIARVSAGIMTGTPKPSRLFDFEAQADDHVADPMGGDNSPVFGAGIGVEYYTRLRHFSIGAEAAIDIISAGGMGLRFYPVIKYTF